jgi:fructose-1,6-bisphosphatase
MKIRGEKNMQKIKSERKKASIPDGETKEQRFVRVATPRVKQAIIKLRLVKQTISSNNYSMTEEQVLKIVETLDKEIRLISQSYSLRNKPTTKEEINFNL